MAKVGVFGGTFNPPHIGHLICAEAALSQLHLDRVVFVPAGQPPHKEVAVDPGREHRLEMALRAISGNNRFVLSEIEIVSPEPSFTSATLEVLHEQLPGDDLTLILGADMARSLPTWHQPESVVEQARIAVAGRQGTDHSEITDSLQSLGADSKVDFFAMPQIAISSTLIRQYLATGLSIRYLVPDPVFDYIEQNSLYRPQEVKA